MTLDEPYEVIRSINMPKVERRKCEMCGKKRNCIETLTIAGPYWFCERECHFLGLILSPFVIFVHYFINHADEITEELKARSAIDGGILEAILLKGEEDK